MLGWKNWEELFGRSVGSHLQLEKTGAEQERQSGIGVGIKGRCTSAGFPL